MRAPWRLLANWAPRAEDVARATPDILDCPAAVARRMARLQAMWAYRPRLRDQQSLRCRHSPTMQGQSRTPPQARFLISGSPWRQLIRHNRPEVCRNRPPQRRQPSLSNSVLKLSGSRRCCPQSAGCRVGTAYQWRHTGIRRPTWAICSRMSVNPLTPRTSGRRPSRPIRKAALLRSSRKLGGTTAAQ
jgi:hypothetical protein